MYVSLASDDQYRVYNKIGKYMKISTFYITVFIKRISNGLLIVTIQYHQANINFFLTSNCSSTQNFANLFFSSEINPNFIFILTFYFHLLTKTNKIKVKTKAFYSDTLENILLFWIGLDCPKSKSLLKIKILDHILLASGKYYHYWLKRISIPQKYFLSDRYAR